MSLAVLRSPMRQCAALIQRTSPARSRAYRACPVLARQGKSDSGGSDLPVRTGPAGALGFPAFGSPFMHRFRDLEREMDSLMRGFGLSPLDTSFMPQNALSLAVDVEDKGDKFLIHADVPGMKKEDVKVEVTPDHVLTITAERKSEERTEEKGGFVRMERSYGSFARAFRLPEHADLENIRAELKEGVLELTVPKRDIEEPKKTISVQVA